jgi:molybdate-binding protein
MAQTWNLLPVMLIRKASKGNLRSVSKGYCHVAIVHTVRKTAVYEITEMIETVLTNTLCHVPIVIREKKHSIVPLRDQMSAV